MAACVGAAAALAACGSSGSGTHSANAPAAGGNGESAKPPTQILSDAAAALRSARGYVMEGQLRMNSRVLRLRVVAAGSSSLKLTIASGAATAEEIVLPGGAYMRANAAFWNESGFPRASVLSNRWVQIPPAAAQKETALLGPFTPGTLSRCLVEGHGTLSRGGVTTVTGRPAILIKDAGNAPGDGPGTLAVAITGRPYPLELTSTGPQHPGGRIDACNDGKGGDISGTLTLSDFGGVPAITPPPHPIQLGQAAAV